MGIFDFVTCKYGLPIAAAQDLDFQSKDTPSQAMDHYEIREDGSLWCKRWVDPDTPLRNSEEWEPCDHTGVITFSGWGREGGAQKRFDFVAEFRGGQLYSLDGV